MGDGGTQGNASWGRIGPNAITQTLAALIALEGHAVAGRVFEVAGLRRYLDSPPEDLLPETEPAALFAALWTVLSPSRAVAVAAEAGMRTADYVMANRIPPLARLALRLLPARLAAPLLLQAIERNAWTFAGSGACVTRSGAPGLIEIKDNPLAMPDAAWHVAVFERMFRSLVSPGARVRHVSALSVSRFEIDC